jgi:exodeoxyribonuclease V beta subunit
MKALDPFDTDLGKTILIEASAGTGKTYTITTLYCRLVAEGYRVESILVVTFTEAAAAELKLRIRSRIADTLENLARPEPDNEEDDLSAFLRESTETHIAVLRLKLALTCFDQSSVMTIHSFCMKILKENAFESRSYFDIELAPDRSKFAEQVSRDFFMAHVNDLDVIFLKFLDSRSVSPESFLYDFDKVLSKTDIAINPGPGKFENNFEDYRKTIKKIHEILATRQDEISDLIAACKGIEKRSYSKKNVPVWLEAAFQKLEDSGSDTFFDMEEKKDSLFRFTCTRLRNSTKPGFEPPEHEFFNLCEHLLSWQEKFKSNLIWLEHKFLSFFISELEKKKQKDAVCFFDDLVNDLAAALEGPERQGLVKAVRKNYQACLIDEFQDTDPRQYDIFSGFFSSAGTPFFMIGDPKQAIYAFRGADIFAYLKACRQARHRFTLERNYRSSAMLVNGVNAVFSSSKNPFVFKGIEFSKVLPSQGAGWIVRDNGMPVPPLQFNFMLREDFDLDRQGFIPKKVCNRIIPEAVADDIAGLISSELTMVSHNQEKKRVEPGDIAVLVRTNFQAGLIHKALSLKGIPSYLSGSGSVFDSEQAVHLYEILWAVLHADDRGAVRAGLCTSVFGFSPDEMIALDAQDLFGDWQDRFRQYRSVWENSGFASMIMQIFHCEEAFFKTGNSLNERALTNFYHLAELISGAELEKKLTPGFLLKWYANQMNPESREESADELRLETDRTAVTIVTIHKSKGLEYPVVYLPYLWEGHGKKNTGPVVFHDPENEYRLTLDLGSSDRKRAENLNDKEETAEQARLLYVALTRASALCRIFWGGFNSIAGSALGILVHSGMCTSDEEMVQELEKLCAPCKDSICIRYCDLTLKQEFDQDFSGQAHDLSEKKITRQIEPLWKISSFSAIAGDLHVPVAEKADLFHESDNTLPEITLAGFPKGAAAGEFFHSIFETLDFTASEDAVEDCVNAHANAAGLNDPIMNAIAVKSVCQVLSTRLDDGKNSFCLKDISLKKRFSEMQFFFPINSFSMQALVKALEHSRTIRNIPGYAEGLLRAGAGRFSGFMKGFIDLVIIHRKKWYIVDYKTNFLGNTYDRYSVKALNHSMAEHHYFLQYHFYLAALHRYLGLRLENYDYNRDFGGIFYLFIRGMHPDLGSGHGVFFDRPEKKVVHLLSESFNQCRD